MAFGNLVIAVMQPAMPFWRHAAGIIGAIINDPAMPGWMTGSGFFCLIIDIAKHIFADALDRKSVV